MASNKHYDNDQEVNALVKQWLQTNRNFEQLNKKLPFVTVSGDVESLQLMIQMGADVNWKDRNGWNSLHWAAASRQLKAFLYLKQHGGDINLPDTCGKTPMDLLHSDLERLNFKDLDLPFGEAIIQRGLDIYTWGTTSFFALGHPIASKSNEKNPRKLRFFEFEDITNVAVSQYHTVVATKEGDIYSWGLGEGFRLGSAAEVQITPCKMEQLSELKVVRVAASNHHTAVITKDGELYTFGKGEYGELGHGSLQSDICVTKPQLVAALKGVQVVEVALSQVHSCVVTSDGELYTFGKGAGGVLGLGNFENQYVPCEVQLQGVTVSSISVSQYMTVVLCGNMDIYIFGLGNCRPKRLKFPWGYPSTHRPNCFVVESVKCVLNRIFLLSDDFEMKRQIYMIIPSTQLAPQNKTQFVPVELENRYADLFYLVDVFKVGSFDSIHQIVASDQSLFITSQMGDLYQWEYQYEKYSSLAKAEKNADIKKMEMVEIVKQHAKDITLGDQSAHSFAIGKDWKSGLGNTEILVINGTAKRAYPEIKIAQFYTGSHHNVALVPKTRSIADHRQVKDSTFIRDMMNIMNDSSSMDIKLIGSDGSLMAHSFILARSNVLAKMIQKQRTNTDSPTTLHISASIAVIKALMYFLYTDLSPVEINSVPSGVQALQALASQLEIKSLFDRLRNQSGNKDNTPRKLKPFPHLKEYIPQVFNTINSESDQNIDLYHSDIELITSDGVLNAHSSILIHRCHYFKMMLAPSFAMSSDYSPSGWREASTNKIDLTSIEGGNSRIWHIINYLYGGALNLPLETNVLAQVAVISDHLLLDSLKETCLAQLFKQISVSNTFQVMEVANVLNDEKLKAFTLNFVIINIDRFIRSNLLQCYVEQNNPLFLDVICSEFQKTFQKKQANMFLTYDKEVMVAEIEKSIISSCSSKKQVKNQKTKENKVPDPKILQKIDNSDSSPKVKENKVEDPKLLQKVEIADSNTPTNTLVVPIQSGIDSIDVTPKTDNPNAKQQPKKKLFYGLTEEEYQKLNPKQRNQLKNTQKNPQTPQPTQPTPSPSQQSPPPKPEPEKPKSFSWANVKDPSTSVPSLIEIQAQEQSKKVPTPAPAPLSPKLKSNPPPPTKNRPNNLPNPSLAHNVSPRGIPPTSPKNRPTSTPMSIAPKNKSNPNSPSPSPVSPSPLHSYAHFESSSPPKSPLSTSPKYLSTSPTTTLPPRSPNPPRQAPTSTTALSSSPPSFTWGKKAEEEQRIVKLIDLQAEEREMYGINVDKGAWKQTKKIESTNLLNIMSEQLIDTMKDIERQT